MLYLAFIFHMHQPYYKNLLTQVSEVPWVRLHGTKDYLDMVEILGKYPKIHQTFNMVPSLLEQVEDYPQGTVRDRFLELSYKPAAQLTHQDKQFLLDRFFSINRDRVIATHPRYYELYLKYSAKREFSEQEFLDLQVWFNLAWIDPMFRLKFPELRAIVNKGRFFTEEEKITVLTKQKDILEDIIPTYRKFIESGQIELTITPYYHPILPLLYNSNIAKEANNKAFLPRERFAFPQDAKAQVDTAVQFYQKRFGVPPQGMWPSEEAVCEHIVPLFMQSGIRWIVADEGILFKSMKSKIRDTQLLYQPHILKRKEGDLNVVFRDRNLSDLIGFVYHFWENKSAVDDFLSHLQNIHDAFKGRNMLVTVAMDGENAWEYYPNDGHDFLNLLYQRLSEASFLKTVTVSEYFRMFTPSHQIKRLAAGSWIYSEFGKWIGSPQKNKAWEYLARARQELENVINAQPKGIDMDLAWKQMYICEGSDWFWWYGDNQMDFDMLFRMHLSNFYTIIGHPIPEYLKYPL